MTHALVHVFTKHMENRVSTCMECQIVYKWEVFVDEGGGSRKGKEKGRKEEKGKREKKEKKGKRKRKRERGRRPTVSSLNHWRSYGRNSLDQEVKSGDSTRGYASRG